jgi:hypothetical protein
MTHLCQHDTTSAKRSELRSSPMIRKDMLSMVLPLAMFGELRPHKIRRSPPASHLHSRRSAGVDKAEHCRNERARGRSASRAAPRYRRLETAIVRSSQRGCADCGRRTMSTLRPSRRPHRAVTRIRLRPARANVTSEILQQLGRPRLSGRPTTRSFKSCKPKPRSSAR